MQDRTTYAPAMSSVPLPGLPNPNHCIKPRARTLALDVISTPRKPAIAKSRYSKWRAAVLIGVWLLMFAHLGQWAWSRYHGGSGRTLSPVEPSESMYAIELGHINAGFVFFALALLSTFVFGRFFCGWGCHIVALQDWCSAIMNKVGVRPKPFRSRLLLLAPLALALYMFVWPTFERIALVPLEKQIATWKGDAAWQFPPWLLDLPRVPKPPIQNSFIVKEYWQTFPSDWYIIIPFFGVCGFAAVYFLGSKGFCTYGCPYGGFFAPLDKISIGRIVVNDDCEQCGHCTAVCTSNVRVAQEVHDFGMVTDPGCMKCLDCVSVCPTNALSFSFAVPPILSKKARAGAAAAASARRPEYDVTWWQDVILLMLCVAFFLAFRQAFNKIPLLMAGGMSLLAVFTAWKLWSLAATPNVRLQSLQLKLKGKLKPAGIAMVLGGMAYLAFGAWCGVVQGALFLSNVYYTRLAVPSQEVLSAGYTPREVDRENARRAEALLRFADAPSYAGFGWHLSSPLVIRSAYLRSVMKDYAGADAAIRRVASRKETPYAPVIFQLAQVMQLEGRTAAEARTAFEEIVELHPELYAVRLALAEDSLSINDRETAVRIAREVLASDDPAPDSGVRMGAALLLHHSGQLKESMATLDAVLASKEPPPDADAYLRAAAILSQSREMGRARAVLAEAVAKFPKIAVLHAQYAVVLGSGNDLALASNELAEAAALDPTNLEYLGALGETLQGLGRHDEAAQVMERARKIREPLGSRDDVPKGR